MADLLTIGSSAIRTYSNALSVTSGNIANANTEGYARRTLTSTEAVNGGDILYYRSNLGGNGSSPGSISRQVDIWRLADLRSSHGHAANLSTQSESLTAVGQVLNSNENGVGDAISGVFNAANALSANPSSSALRMQFLSKVDGAAAAFRQTAEKLADVAGEVTAKTGATVELANTTLQSLHDINQALRTARSGSTQQASLMDERDRQLNQLAGIMDVGIQMNAQGGVTITSETGAALLNTNGAAILSTDPAAPGQLSVLQGGITQLIAPSSGTIAGLFQSSDMISDQQAQLDGVASAFHDMLNNFQAAGLDSTGAPGGAMMAMTAGAASLTLAITDPQLVAAADAVSDNGNVMALGDQKDSSPVLTQWNALANTHNSMAALNAQQSALATNLFDAAQQEYLAGSSVDLDQEAADLLRFQQGYQGAARILQVARETMQTLLNSI